MHKHNKNLKNRNLLSQIDRMLHSLNKGLIYRNSLLGFCAKLIALKPQASPYYQGKLLDNLLKNYPLKQNPTLRSLVVALPKLRFDNILPKFNFKVASLLVSLVCLIAFASGINPQNNQDASQKQVLTPAFTSKIVLGNPKTNLSQSTNKEGNTIDKFTSSSKRTIERGEFRIIQEDYGFKLIEYILPDGSTIKVIKGLL